MSTHLAAATEHELRYYFFGTGDLYAWHRIDKKLHGDDQPLRLPPDTKPCPECAATHAALCARP